jgi:hypothetical protein
MIFKFIHTSQNLPYYVEQSLMTILRIEIITQSLAGFQLETIWSDMTNFTTMVASSDKLLRSVSLMWKDIRKYRSSHRKVINNFFILVTYRKNKYYFLIPKSLGLQLKTIWSNVTNNLTMVARDGARHLVGRGPNKK